MKDYKKIIKGKLERKFLGMPQVGDGALIHQGRTAIDVGEHHLTLTFPRPPFSDTVVSDAQFSMRGSHVDDATVRRWSTEQILEWQRHKLLHNKLALPIMDYIELRLRRDPFADAPVQNLLRRLGIPFHLKPNMSCMIRNVNVDGAGWLDRFSHGAGVRLAPQPLDRIDNLWPRG